MSTLTKDMLRKQAEDLLKVSSIEPEFQTNGQDFYTYEDSKELSNAILRSGIPQDTEMDVRDTINQGMSYTSSRKKNTAINPASFFNMRFRTIETPAQEAVKAAPGRKAQEAIPATTAYEVVIDQRALREQNSGRVYSHVVATYIVSKKGEGLNIVRSSVNDTTFMNEFVNQMPLPQAKRIMNAIMNETFVQQDASVQVNL